MWRPLLLFLLLTACATTPHAWQDPATGARASVEDITGCEMAARLEAERSLFLSGWGWGWGYGGYGGWGRRWVAPGFGWGVSSANLALLRRTQELTSFCLRVKGFQWLPVTPATAAPGVGEEQEGKPAQKPAEDAAPPALTNP